MQINTNAKSESNFPSYLSYELSCFATCRCKKHVNAEKRFTIHEAPLVLTVHLKRFSPLGKKLSHPLQYEETLSLQHCMSAGVYGPTYSLYGVICHAGGGPNSGHYYAFIKSKEGRWFEMNDEIVQSTGTPTDKKNAYMLFYIQNKGQSLEAAVKAPLTNGVSSSSIKSGLAAGMKKKNSKPKDAVDEEDKGVKLDAPLIGPLLPSPDIQTNGTTFINQMTTSTHVDPQASALKSKIQAVGTKTVPSKALESLGNYDSDSDEPEKAPASQDADMDVDTDGKRAKKGNSSVDEPPKLPSPLSAPQTSSPIPPSKFYASINSNKKKRRLSELENQNSNKRTASAIQARTNGYVSSNPFGKPLGKRKRMGI